MRRFRLIVICVLLVNISQLPKLTAQTHESSPPVQAFHYLARLTPSSPDYFGLTLAISGNTVVVLGGSAGYVFVKPPSGWANMTQTAKLTPSDGNVAMRSIAIDGDTVVIGNPFVGSASQGAAYVFVKPPGGWKDMNETGKLTASDGARNDRLGRSVAVSGDTVIASAPQQGTHGNPGSVYVFVRPGGGWKSTTQTAKLTSSDGSNDDELGDSVAINADTIVAGAPLAIGEQGAAYAFVKPSNGWKNATQTAKLTSSDTGGYLGFTVSVSGDTITAGAYLHDGGHGAIYIFAEPSGGWANGTETAQLTVATGDTDYYVGTSAAVYGNLVLTGGMARSDDRGAVYAFVKPESGWQTTSSFAGKTLDRHDFFGDAVALSGDTGVIGEQAAFGLGQAFVVGRAP